MVCIDATGIATGQRRRGCRSWARGREWKRVRGEVGRRTMLVVLVVLLGMVVVVVIDLLRCDVAPPRLGWSK